jgi:type I restriction enzyme S subunit
MIADLKPYAEYKESGLPWLGRVPGHWEVKRLKNWVTINRHTLGEDTPADFEFDYLDIGAVTTGRLAKLPARMRFSDAPSRARRVLQSGDTIVSTVRTYLKAVLTVNECSQPLVASTGFAVLSLRADTTPRCLGYVAQSEAFTNQVTAESVGIAYPAISETRLGNIAVTLPPPDEQAAIVRFLDWANGRLERAIRAKRKVIALLSEQKQAIIHRAVTRGLDPSVPLKPSGIPWLGDIPWHWEVIRSKWLFCQRKDLALPDDVQMSATQAYGVIPQADFEEKVGRRVVKISMHLDKRRHVEKDDFVISMRSFQGGLERAWSSGAIRSSYVVLRSRQAVDTDTDFFSYLFKSRGYIRALQATGDFIRDGQDLNFTNFCRIDLPLIPINEQRAIAKFIADSTRGLDSAIHRLSREIDLLREYRTRLVADVVTGKLDVREAAARLPDEAPPDLAADDADLGDKAEAIDEEAAV